MSCCQPTPTAAAPATSWVKLIAALVVAGNAMLWSLAVNPSELQPQERRGLHAALGLAALLVVGLCGGPLGRALWQNLRARRLGVEGLFATGMLGATATSCVSLWRGDGPTYFEVVGILVGIYALSARIKQAAQAQLQAALTAAIPAMDACLLLPTDGGPPRRVPVVQIKAGDIVAVAAGETIPIDGNILVGEAFINEASLTGEGLCRARGVGDGVGAGSRNVDGTLQIRAAVAGSARAMDRLFAAVRKGSTAREGLAGQAERLAGPFFFVVIGVATATFAGWGWAQGWEPAFLHAMAVLLVACPCALGFATPVGMWTAVVRLAQLKVHTRNLLAVERLAEVDHLLFDKTGTLTTVDPQVGQLLHLPKSPLPAVDLTARIAATQALSDHPIARAFVAGAAPAAPEGLRPTSTRVLPGRGIEAQFVDARGTTTLRLGDLQRLASAADHQAFAPLLARLPTGSHVIAIYVDGVAAALAQVIDAPVAKLNETFAALQAMGVQCAVCSGDDAARLAPFAALPTTGSMRPEDKSARVLQLQRQGHRVAFVGDGLNDAAALAQSHASLAIAGGTSLAIAAADFTLAQGDLVALPAAIAICRQTLKVVRSNLKFAAAYNLLGMGVAAAGVLHPVFAALLMVAASLTVTLRSARLLHMDPLTDVGSPGLDSARR